MTGSEDFQIIDPDGYQTVDDRLDRLREIYQNETCKSAINRTRRAETNAKALEVILKAQTEDTSSSPSTSEELQMELEDTYSRLSSRIKEVELLRSQISDLKSQQMIDNENIESLQESLERLHRVSGEYRSDRDKLSSQLIGLFTSIKNAGSDESVSMDQLKSRLDSGDLVLLHSDSIKESEETREKISELQKLVELRDTVIVEKQSVIDDLSESVRDMQSTIKNLNSQIAHLGKTNESLVQEVKAQVAQVSEYETKITEWTEWAANVTTELESRNKEIELLEEFKKHATEEIGLLDERVRELTANSDSDIEVETLREKIAELESEKTELEKKIYDWSEWAEATTREMEELKANDDSLILRGELEKVTAENVSNLAQLESVKTALAELRSELNEKEIEIEKLKSVYDELKRAETKIANLTDQLQISENLVSGAAEQLESERTDLRNDLDELKAKLVVRETTISVLGKQIDELRSAPVSEDPQRLIQIQSLEAEVLALREAQGSAQEREIEVHKLHGEIAILNDENEILKVRIDQLENENESMMNEVESNRVELRSRKVELDTLVNNQVDLNSIEKEREALRDEIQRLEGRIAEMELMESNLRLEIEDQKKRVDESSELVQLRSQLDESVVVADRLREQIRMLEENLSMLDSSTSLVAERADMEQKLIAWNKWADEVTNQLAERDATIADLMSGRENLDESLRQAEELRQRVADLESTAVERERNLSDESPIGKRMDELEKAHAEISVLRDLLEKAHATPRTNSPGVVSSEEAEVLLDAYRAEIDRLSKENSKLRTEMKKTSTSDSSGTKAQSATAPSSSSWWNVLPDIEDDENEITK